MISEAKRAWREANRAKMKAARKAWTEANRERVNAVDRAWRKANPEKVKAYQRAWRNVNPERINALRIARRDKTNAEFRAWFKANPDKARDQQYRKFYGITLEQYDAMFAKQAGRCAICGTDKPGRQRLHVDHCHATKKVRGLLCFVCNTRLGIVEGWGKKYATEIRAHTESDLLAEVGR